MDDLMLYVMANSPVLADFNIGNLLSNAKGKVEEWGGMAVVLIGAVMIVVAGFQIARGLMTQGKPGGQQTNWLVVILLLIVGGGFLLGGYTLLKQVAEVGKDTIEDLGQGGSPSGSGSASVPSVISWAHQTADFVSVMGVGALFGF